MTKKLLASLIMLFLSFFAWAVSSPAGSSPDDDFHLGSIWCGQGYEKDICTPTSEPLTANYGLAITPKIFDPCFVFKPSVSASCVQITQTEKQINKFNNHLYPKGFYFTENIFVTSNISNSILMMRLFNALIFVALLGLAIYLSPRNRQKAVVYTSAIALVPIGAFIIPSTNPSSWTISGCAFGWVFLSNFTEQLESKPIRPNGTLIFNFILYIFCFALVLFSRFDGSILFALITIAILIPHFARHITLRSKKGFLLLLIPTLLGLITKKLGLSFQNIIFPTKDLHPELSIADQLINNVINLFEIPLQMLGLHSRLGWLDIPIPDMVGILNFGLFTLMVFGSLPLTRRVQTLSWIAIFSLLMLLPQILLHWFGAIVGEEVQARYVYPILFFVIGYAIANAKNQVDLMSDSLNSQMILSFLTFITFYFSLSTYIRRFITGMDTGNIFSLNKGVEWWAFPSLQPFQLAFLASLCFSIGIFNLTRITKF